MTIAVRHSEGFKGRVLIIDDDTATLTVLSKALSRDAFDVETASSARDALTRLTRSDFDLLISDIRMPEFDGRQLFGFIQDHFPDYAARVIFLTGDPGEDTAEFLAGTRAVHFTKPPDLRQLLETVNALVVGSRAQSEAAAPPTRAAAAAVGAAVGAHHGARLEIEAAQLRREVAEGEQQMRELGARLERLTHELSSARLQASTASEEVTGLRDELGSKEREIGRLTRRMERAEAEAAAERDSLYGELDRVRKQLAQSIGELEALRSDATQRDAEMQAVRQEHARREAELDARVRREMAAAAAQSPATPAATAAVEDERVPELEGLVRDFYKLMVRPLTIMSAHLEMAAGTSQGLGSDDLVELSAAMQEMKRGLAELARKMEALGIRPTSA